MKPAFKMPERKRVDDWVAAAGEGEGRAQVPSARAPMPKVKLARLTIDLEQDDHARFKSACALNSTDMVTEVRAFIKAWIQKHS